MKKSEEIKKGLECYSKRKFCAGRNCPYYNALCDYENIMVDALSLIQQLEAQVPRWISVEERMPEDDGDVLLVIDSEIGLGYYSIYFDEWVDYTRTDVNHVTHWMPLPSTEGLHDN